MVTKVGKRVGSKVGFTKIMLEVNVMERGCNLLNVLDNLKKPLGTFKLLINIIDD